MKHIIWSNMENIKIEDWKDGYIEHLEINDIEVPETIDDDDVYAWATEMNNEYLGDERLNLDKTLDGRVLCIVDLGLWNGHKQGYKIMGNNLNDIFDINGRGFDYAEFYGDGHNVMATECHHDGTNHYEFRMIREDRNIDNLLEAIYNGEEISRQKMNYYTKSLYKVVADVYGWR